MGPEVMDVLRPRKGAIMVGKVESLHTRLRPEPKETTNSYGIAPCTWLAASRETSSGPAVSKDHRHTI